MIPFPLARAGLAGASLLLATWLPGLTYAQTSSNLVINGGFEDPGPGITIPPGGFHTYSAGSTFPGWRVESGDVDIQTSAHGIPHSGLYALDLSGFGPGSVSQTLLTIPGQQYTLELWYAAHPFHPYSGPAQAQVWWGGANIGLLSIETLNQMTHVQFVVTASSSTTTLSLISLSPNGGIIVDDVSVVAATSPSTGAAIPTLSTWGLLLFSALLGLLGFRRPRRYS